MTDIPVLVKGDREVPYGKVVEAMDIARGAGVERVGIISDTRAAAPAAQ